MSKVYCLMNDDDTVFYVFSTKEKALDYLKKEFLPNATHDEFLDLYYDPNLNDNWFVGNGDAYMIVEHPIDPEAMV